MTDEQRREKQPLSMTRRYRRGLILTGVLCVLAMLAAATVLFQRSYTDRVDKSRSKATGGTGLGLAIVKHIALLHDAKIDLQSQVGTGTTIRVTFPKNS